MHVPHSPRRRPRRLLFLAGFAGLLASLVAPSGALAADAHEYWSPSPNGLSGWYTYPAITVQVRVLTDGFAFSTYPGAYDERIAKVECGPSPTVTGGFEIPRYDDTIVYVDIAGDTGPDGVAAGCTATFERRYYSCSILGCAAGAWQPYATRTWVKNVRIDSSRPVIDAPIVSVTPNAAGWYRTPGTVEFTASDPHSGILTCTGGAISGPDSAIKGFSGGCTNRAGLQQSTSFQYKYDATAPSLAPTVSPNPVLLGGAASATPNATDATSGIASATCDPLDTSSIGAHTVECQATDNAGNTSTASVGYTVGLEFDGFAAPVDMTAVNVAKAGRTIPLKWRVTDANGDPVTSLTAAAVRATGVSCDLGSTADQVEEYASGATGLQNLGDGYYQYNWASPKSYANSCKLLHVDAGDGIEHTAEFRFVK